MSTAPDDAAVFDALVASRNEQPQSPAEVQAPADAGVSVSEGDADEVAETTAPEATAEPDDFDLDSLPAKARERIEEAERLRAELHRVNSEKLAALNRLQPTQRKLAEYERREREGAQQPKPAPQAAPEATAAASHYDSPEWKRYEAEFPDEAKAIRASSDAQARELAELREQLTSFKQAVEPRIGSVDEFMQKQAKDREVAALDKAHPDWREIVLPSSQDDAMQLGDGDTFVRREFGEWLLVQNPAIQSLFGSKSARDNEDLVSAFKRDAYIAQHYAEPAVTTDPNAEAALAAQQRREQARATSVAPDLKGSPAAARVDFSRLSDAEKFDLLLKQRGAKT